MQVSLRRGREHDYSRCASARYLPSSPALSAPSVPASQHAGELGGRRATDFNLLTNTFTR
jgi:hypothetical protein